MKNIHIENSYKIWKASKMRYFIGKECRDKFGSYEARKILHRTYESMYVEWWLHNIGYYITKPLCFIYAFYKINLRCKDVDLEEWRVEE